MLEMVHKSSFWHDRVGLDSFQQTLFYSRSLQCLSAWRSTQRDSLLCKLLFAIWEKTLQNRPNVGSKRAYHSGKPRSETASCLDKARGLALFGISLENGGYSELACLHGPLPRTPSRRTTAHMAPWALWMGRRSQSGRTRAREASHLSRRPLTLSLKWINNGREENSEQNESVIIIRGISQGVRQIYIHLWFSKKIWRPLWFPQLCPSHLQSAANILDSLALAARLQHSMIKNSFSLLSYTSVFPPST